MSRQFELRVRDTELHTQIIAPGHRVELVIRQESYNAVYIRNHKFNISYTIYLAPETDIQKALNLTRHIVRTNNRDDANCNFYRNRVLFFNGSKSTAVCEYERTDTFIKDDFVLITVRL